MTADRLYKFRAYDNLTSLFKSVEADIIFIRALVNMNLNMPPATKLTELGGVLGGDCSKALVVVDAAVVGGGGGVVLIFISFTRTKGDFGLSQRELERARVLFTHFLTIMPTNV
uniref:Uncharacterized protein n=1 Tax=Glossina austeni TaxID=7395 RepID=A0A1A9VY53_GLOAU